MEKNVAGHPDVQKGQNVMRKESAPIRPKIPIPELTKRAPAENWKRGLT